MTPTWLGEWPEYDWQGHGVVRAGSLHMAGAGLRYPDSVLDRDIKWQTLWSASA